MFPCRVSLAVPGAACSLDATSPLPFGERFDRILIDAPCSGTGTLARNPEIKWRLKPADLARFEIAQRAMLNQARRIRQARGTPGLLHLLART